jgi:flagellar motor component MotA
VRRHEPDLVSFIFGLFFASAAVVWGVGRHNGHPVHGWAFPALLIVVGGVGLLTSVAVRRHGSGDADDRPDGTDPS